MTPPRSPGRRALTFAVYLATLAGGVAVFLFVTARGRGLEALRPAGEGISGAEVEAAAGGGALLHVLLAMLTVIVASRLVGMAFQRIGQPAVIGEITAGILLGPSLLGRAAPEVAAYLFPAGIAPTLAALSQVGVILFMFLVGLELDGGLLRKRTEASIAVSHASIVVPFVLGGALALLLYPRLAPAGVPFTVFALFMGISMSVTAFPVLARILTDRGLQRTPLGAIALACAAVDDVTAWCLLAFVVGVAQAEPEHVLVTLALTAGYLALMITAARPAVRWFARRIEARGTVSQGVMAAVFTALLLSAFATERIGIHALFGAFLLGALVPHDSVLARGVRARLEDVVVVLLLPVFFAVTGLRTEVQLVSGAGSWLLCGLIVLVASIGKFGGSAVAARLTGLDWRHSAALGALMNTRGLMELIVLNIGLDLGVLSPTLFAMLVIMALVTTFATAPALSLFTRGRGLGNGAERLPQSESPSGAASTR